MFVDARSIPNDEQLDADICIVGAGAAGISMAMEFIRAPFRVLLVEGGGLKFRHKNQFLHRGKTRGRAFPPPENTRRRQFGGTTATWFGRCRPLDAIDYEARPGFPDSGWPISKPEVDACIPRALGLLQIEPGDFHSPTDLLSDAGLEGKLFRFSPPTQFGVVYRQPLREASNVRVLLHANAVEIELDPTGARTTRILCATLNGKRVAVAGRFFILAAGGLEIPRLLLNSRRVHASGIGNSGDLVGRTFMEHIYSFAGAVESFPAGFPADYLRLNYESFQRHIKPTPAIGLPQALMREQALPNAAGFFVRRPSYKTDDRFYSHKMQGFMQLLEVVQHRIAPSRRVLGNVRDTVVNAPTIAALMVKAVKAKLGGQRQYGLHVQLEQIPNRESRVTLADSRDRLGVRELCVDWRLQPQDLDGKHRFEATLMQRLEAGGVRMRRLQHDLDEEGWPVHQPSSRHHMGTTRMSREPRLGIVNENCRMHEVGNLYVASSSVFPTSGMANPTLMIVTLAVRLADHIKRVAG